MKLNDNDNVYCLYSATNCDNTTSIQLATQRIIDVLLTILLCILKFAVRFNTVVVHSAQVKQS